jgi:hypothetical protein
MTLAIAAPVFKACCQNFAEAEIRGANSRGVFLFDASINLWNFCFDASGVS